MIRFSSVYGMAASVPLVIVLLSLMVCGCGTVEHGPKRTDSSSCVEDSPTEASASVVNVTVDISKNAFSRLDAVTAARRGLRAIRWLRSDLDFFDQSGRIYLKRQSDGCWIVEVRFYSALSNEALWIRVLDNGRTETADGPLVLPSALEFPPVQRDPLRLVPEEAIRKLLVVVKARFPDVDLCQTGGVIKWGRGPEKGWTMDASKYDGLPLRRCWGYIDDRGDVDVGLTP